jgi:hypothetical protein
MKLSETHASTLAIDVLQKAIESLSGGATAIEDAIIAVNAEQEAALSE